KKVYGANYRHMVLELNGSDDRGINIIRTKIKQFCTNRGMFSDNVKLVILDEVDSMTLDAQSALRRVIEIYTFNTRFCLICNYVSKIIPAIQSRCMQFRFLPISAEFMAKKLKDVSKKEKMSINRSGIESIVKIANGDMRRAYNILQATSMLNAGDTKQEINENIVYRCSGNPTPTDIKNIYDILTDKLTIRAAWQKLQIFRIEKGIALVDIVKELGKLIVQFKIADAVKISLITDLANIELHLSASSSDNIHMLSLISVFKKISSS
ncbi:MAG: hypothetical protein Faunusvirus54_1, partial [Faunusvirus sp.]